MRALIFAWVVASRGLLRKAILAGRFETLEECEKAYEELLGKTQITAEPEPGPTTTTTTEKPTEAPTAAPTTTTTPLPPMVKGEKGSSKHDDAKPAYHPPRNDGEPSESEGWDYNEHGDDWGSSCQGAGQSPIDIVKFVDIGGQTKSVLWFDYYQDQSLTESTVASLHNDGHGLFYDEKKIDIGHVKIGDSEYEAYEYMFHAPAEHTIDGQVFPLEMQIMHKDSKGDVLGISVLFKYGASNEYLKAVMEAIPDMPVWSSEHGGHRAEVNGAHPDFFNIEEVLPNGEIHPGGDMTFYNYAGSLTQPPCTGGVDWWVSAEAVDASKDEIKHIRNAIMGSESMKRGNNRDTQELGDRKVLVGHTGFQHHIKMHGHKEDVKPDSRGYETGDAPWHE